MPAQSNLSGPPSSWPLAFWEFYRERVAMRAAFGEGEEEAARHAAEDVRRWVELDGEAWLGCRTPTP